MDTRQSTIWRPRATPGTGRGKASGSVAAMDAGRRIHYQCKRCMALVHAVVGRGCGGRACVAGQWKPQRFWEGQMRKVESMVEAESAPIVAGAVDAGSTRSYVLSERDAWAVVLSALRLVP